MGPDKPKDFPGTTYLKLFSDEEVARSGYVRTPVKWKVSKWNAFRLWLRRLLRGEKKPEVRFNQDNLEWLRDLVEGGEFALIMKAVHEDLEKEEDDDD